MVEATSLRDTVTVLKHCALFPSEAILFAF